MPKKVRKMDLKIVICIHFPGYPWIWLYLIANIGQNCGPLSKVFVVAGNSRNLVTPKIMTIIKIKF